VKKRLPISLADPFFVLVILVLAVLLRLNFIGFESRDFNPVISSWYQEVKAHGAASLNGAFSDYAPAYIYCIYIVDKVLPGLAPIATVKVVPVICDFVCAYFGYLIVRLRYANHSPFPFFAFCAILFAPTVMLNSAFWGQIDSMFTAGLIASVYFILRKRETWAWVAFGVALAVKFQALFLAPFLLALLLRGFLSWRRALLVPLVYVLSWVPAFIAGRRLVGMITALSTQTDMFRDLEQNAPNLYTWIPNTFYDWFYRAGLILAVAVVLLYVAAIYKSSVQFDSRLLVQLALVSLLIVPFFTPKMHERFFFPADVLAIVYAFYFTRYFWIPIVIGLVSFFAYEPFIFGKGPFLISWVALVLLFVIAFLVWQMFTLLYPGPAPEADVQPETAWRLSQQ
jgi:Gpi18-like mannosyltransferase